MTVPALKTGTALSSTADVTDPSHLKRLEDGEAKYAAAVAALKTLSEVVEPYRRLRTEEAEAERRRAADRAQAEMQRAINDKLEELKELFYQIVAFPQTADDEQLLMIASATYRRLEQRLASRALVAPVAAHLGFVSELASIRGGSTAQRLHMVVSETAGLAAWLYVDLDDRANARRHYQLAIRSADLTGHPLLPAYMQASLGQFAVTSGDAVQGLRLIGQARQRLPRAAPGVASVWLDTLEAVALAELRDQAALKLLDDAERRLAKASDSEAVWPWIFRFDEPKLAGYRAVAAAKLGRTRLAERAFEVAGTAPQAPKQRAVMELAHARALASGGEVEKACAIAVGAFDAGAALGSARVIHEVAAFRSALGNRAGQAADVLDDRLHATYQEGM